MLFHKNLDFGRWQNSKYKKVSMTPNGPFNDRYYLLDQNRDRRQPKNMQLTILLCTRKTSYITKKITLTESECEKKQWMLAKDKK